jgi:hypothetical protein
LIKDKKSQRNKKFDLTLLEFSRIALKSNLAQQVQMGFETIKATDTTMNIARVLHMIIILGLGLDKYRLNKFRWDLRQ